MLMLLCYGVTNVPYLSYCVAQELLDKEQTLLVLQEEVRHC
jgi:hypothetical protein